MREASGRKMGRSDQTVRALTLDNTRDVAADVWQGGINTYRGEVASIARARYTREEGGKLHDEARGSRGRDKEE